MSHREPIFAAGGYHGCLWMQVTRFCKTHFPPNTRRMLTQCYEWRPLGSALHGCVIEERYDFSYQPKKSDLHCALESNVILGGCTPFYCGRNMPPMYFLCGSSILAQMLKTLYTWPHGEAWELHMLYRKKKLIVRLMYNFIITPCLILI